MMKKAAVIMCFALCTGFNISLTAQKLPGAPDLKYRRSSLHIILMESDKFPMKENVLDAYYKAPFPDKYNNHTVGLKSFDPKPYATIFDTLGNPDVSQHASIIDKHVKQAYIARQLVAKWFNRQEDGTFDMSLIGERGSYDASDMQVNIAKGSARGTSSLADAGEELIGNTFVVVSALNFYSNAKTAKQIYDSAKVKLDKMPEDNEFMKILKNGAKFTAERIYEQGKDGYTVLTNAYLYQLIWNDSIAATFYNDLWTDKTSPNSARKEAFDKSELFTLKFIGDERARSLVAFSGGFAAALMKGAMEGADKSKMDTAQLRKHNEMQNKQVGRTEAQNIELATVRNVDNVFAKLQKKYDVFKTKTPLYTGYPITAKIGLKEGIEKGDKFEVLEQVMDPKTGRTKYVSKGKITVEKKLIWDNRYDLSDGAPRAELLASSDSTSVAPTTSDGKKPKLDRTTFSGGKNYYSGMLIRQIR